MANEKRTEWHYVETDVPAPAADAVGSALVDLGSIGVEQRDIDPHTVRLVAYFYEAPELSDLAAGLAASRWVDYDVARAAAAKLRAGSTPDDDWLRLWKRGFEPTPVGGRLLVFPSWRREDAEAYTDRVRVEVDPGMAFGTGTHETTQLCLEWLDEFWNGGSLLDVGTGTGILAIAAALLRPGAHVVAIDVDPLAVEIARENAVINGVGGIELRACGPEAVEGDFEVVLANLTADVILAVRDALVARTRPGGHLVLSGVLSEQVDDVSRELRAAGLEIEAHSAAEEWVAIVARRP